MQIKPISFKGKYIIDGTKEEINEIEKKLPKTVGHYKHIEKFPIGYNSKGPKYLVLYATDRDSLALNKAKKEPSLMTKLKEIKGNPLDMFKFLANQVFGSEADINLFKASDLLSGSRTLHGFHSSTGVWNGHLVKQLNGGSVTYNYEGEVSIETIAKKEEHGIIRTYKRIGQEGEYKLETEKFPSIF